MMFFERIMILLIQIIITFDINTELNLLKTLEYDIISKLIE